MRALRALLLIGGVLIAVLGGTATVNAAPARQAAGTNYVVRAGDSLVNIATRTYGTITAWNCIWQANRWISNPSYVQAGWSIWLPASCATGGGTPRAGAGSVYTVQRGDTLSGIAVWAYGNAGAWNCIWQANTWIGSPHYLQAGWRLTLPASCATGGGSPGRYHTVTSTQTLSGIACLYYADCDYWRIYNANRDKIWNVNYILPGTVLYIP